MPKASGPQKGVPPTGSINVTWEVGAAAESPELTQKLWGGAPCALTPQSSSWGAPAPGAWGLGRAPASEPRGRLPVTCDQGEQGVNSLPK